MPQGSGLLHGAGCVGRSLAAAYEGMHGESSLFPATEVVFAYGLADQFGD